MSKSYWLYFASTDILVGEDMCLRLCVASFGCCSAGNSWDGGTGLTWSRGLRGEACSILPKASAFWHLISIVMALASSD